MKKYSSVIILIILACASAQGQNNSNTGQPAKKVPDCGCEAKTPPGAVAVVNGVEIGLKQVDDEIKAQIQNLQNQVIAARTHEFNSQIDKKLMEAEAKKRGISLTKLLDQEVTANVKEPTEAEALAFYEQNKARIPGGFAEMKVQIIDYLREQREQQETAKLASRLRPNADVKVIVGEALAPEHESDRARLFATVNGQPITSGDVEDALRPLIFEIQEQIYDLRKSTLAVKINDLLLEQEARKRKQTTRELYEAEVVGKARQVTEADALAFYQQNKAKIPGEFAPLKTQIIEYLSRQERLKRETAFSDDLRKAAKIENFLSPPEPPAYSIATDDQPMRGSPSAPVTIIEFTDFQCPACASTQPLLEELVKEYGDKVRLVVRDFPLTQHANALKAAEAAEAAREQGKYWEFIALLFQNQSALEVEKLKEYATRLGLDRKRFDDALATGKYSEKVRRDLSDGTRIGISSTPSVFINGRLVREKTRETLKSAVEAALKSSGQ
jgi:protein-disulfide isomerase